MTDPAHDGEAATAAYLAGDLCAAGRADFEAHLLGCESCWDELRAARDGRALAESLREAAPQSTREYLRAIAAAGTAAQPADSAGPARGMSAFTRSRRGTDGRSDRSRLAVAAAVVAAAVLAGGLTLGLLTRNVGPGQETLHAAATVYQTGAVEAERSGRPPVPRLGKLTWQGTATQDLAGRPATVYRYGDVTGHRVLLVSSPVQFPRAKNAATVLGSSWTAEINGAVMFCVDHGGLSWLVIGESRDRALAAGQQAGLA